MTQFYLWITMAYHLDRNQTRKHTLASPTQLHSTKINIDNFLFAYFQFHPFIFMRTSVRRIFILQMHAISHFTDATSSLSLSKWTEEGKFFVSFYPKDASLSFISLHAHGAILARFNRDCIVFVASVWRTTHTSVSLVTGFSAITQTN